MRVQATRGMTGGKKIQVADVNTDNIPENKNAMAKWKELQPETNRQAVSFASCTYSVLECNGEVVLNVTRDSAQGPLKVNFATRPGTFFLVCSFLHGFR